ncbi:hypothetical protein [Roseibacillus ishigakijimensis]|uniref:Uncharacterized protein n=1 Tax=Roseibacillus ishigakijimensis TaxID=454146 RepID=A0A934VNG2_9BACT|nr:hypothetical protein [Roseibacillus ishigakijimensis]MBK1835010.1 hypothetical protein [Roseibacillus ishigakijimensis]
MNELLISGLSFLLEILLGAIVVFVFFRVKKKEIVEKACEVLRKEYEQAKKRLDDESSEKKMPVEEQGGKK